MQMQVPVASLALLAAIASAAPAGAQTLGRGETLRRPGTRVSGEVSGVWNKDGSPYRLVGDVSVAALTIRAGVRVVAMRPDVEMLVLGSLSVEGTASEPVTIEAAGGQAWDGLAFAASGASSLRHCTIEDSRNSGIRIVDSPVELFDCTIRGNRGARGGGIDARVAVGDLVLRRTRIEGNEATGEGGGIRASLSAGQLLLEGCEVVANRSADPSSGHNVDAGGGGIYVAQADRVSLTDTEVALNECVGFTSFCYQNIGARGAGLHVANASMDMVRCTVRENRAVAWGGACGRSQAEPMGGGIYFDAPGEVLSMTNCVVGGNVSWGDAEFQENLGGGLRIQRGILVATNCTIARNLAVEGSQFGGATFFPNSHPGLSLGGSASAEILNSILFLNRLCSTGTAPGTSCSGVPAPGPQIAGSSSYHVTFSDVQFGASGTGNLQEEPLFAGAGTSYHDLSILAVSPCVDAGHPAAVYEDVAFPPSHGGARNDMGMNGGPLAGGWLTSPAR